VEWPRIVIEPLVIVAVDQVLQPRSMCEQLDEIDPAVIGTHRLRQLRDKLRQRRVPRESVVLDQPRNHRGGHRFFVGADVPEIVFAHRRRIVARPNARDRLVGDAAMTDQHDADGRRRRFLEDLRCELVRRRMS
jgi:hypothetical protein